MGIEFWMKIVTQIQPQPEMPYRKSYTSSPCAGYLLLNKNASFSSSGVCMYELQENALDLSFPGFFSPDFSPSLSLPVILFNVKFFSKVIFRENPLDIFKNMIPHNEKKSQSNNIVSHSR